MFSDIFQRFIQKKTTCRNDGIHLAGKFFER